MRFHRLRPQHPSRGHRWSLDRSLHHPPHPPFGSRLWRRRLDRSSRRSCCVSLASIRYFQLRNMTYRSALTVSRDDVARCTRGRTGAATALRVKAAARRSKNFILTEQSKYAVARWCRRERAFILWSVERQVRSQVGCNHLIPV